MCCLFNGFDCFLVKIIGFPQVSICFLRKTIVFLRFGLVFCLKQWFPLGLHCFFVSFFAFLGVLEAKPKKINGLLCFHRFFYRNAMFSLGFDGFFLQNIGVPYVLIGFRCEILFFLGL